MATQGSLADFRFQAKANSVGSSITVSAYAPSAGDAPSWNRNVIILKKQGEWPQSETDADAQTVFNGTWATEGLNSYTLTGLVPNQTYYFCLFTEGGTSGELVLNGTFAINLDDWTLFADGIGSVTWNSGTMRIQTNAVS